MKTKYKTTMKRVNAKSDTRKAVEKLDRIFSHFVRLRDSDEKGYGYCCTCGKLLHWTEGQAGHFVVRQKMAVRFNERNVHLQCIHCNHFMEGRQADHARYIDKKYGEGTSDLLIALGRNVSKATAFEYNVLIADYQLKVKSMKEAKG